MKRKTVEQRLTDLLNKLSDAKDRLTKPYIEDRIFVLQMQSKEVSWFETLNSDRNTYFISIY